MCVCVHACVYVCVRVATSSAKTNTKNQITAQRVSKWNRSNPLPNDFPYHLLHIFAPEKLVFWEPSGAGEQRRAAYKS